MIRIASFDVFDTLLVRNVTRPEDVFLDIGSRLAHEGSELSPESWQTIRIAAEEQARQQSRTREVQLKEIYQHIKENLSWTSQQCTHAMDLEIKAERDAIHPVPGGLHAVSAARQQGLAIAFLTDMYLPQEVIQSILVEFGFFQEGDLLLVSSAQRCSKADGKLFHLLAAKQDVRLDQILHHGDNRHSDIAMPRSLGVRVQPMTAACPNRYETQLQGAPLSGAFFSRLAGAARMARLLEPGHLNPQEACIHDVSSGVAGPILLGYLYWVLTQAERLGIQRLYFISREGQILRNIAAELVKALSLSVELRYLYGSRQAWFVREPNSQRHGMPPSVDGNTSSRTWELARDYLLQESLCDGTPWAMVDLGWKGRLQYALGNLLSENSQEPITGFYFALDKNHLRRDHDRLFTYHTGRDPHLLVSWLTYAALLELFTAADHGQVIGYQAKEHGIQPQLNASRNESALAWGLGIQQKAIMHFVRDMISDSRPEDWSIADWHEATARSAAAFFQHPTPQEAAVYGKVEVFSGMIESRAEEMAVTLSSGRILARLLSGEQSNGTHWLEASIVRSIRLRAPWLQMLRFRRQLGFWRWKRAGEA